MSTPHRPADEHQARDDGKKPAFVVTRIKSIPEPLPGYKRSWLRCKRHGRPYYRDYVPYSLSNPVMWLDCGCNPKSSEVESVDERTALTALYCARAAREDR